MKQPNQFTYRDTIIRSREKAEAQKAVIEAEIKALEAEIEKRRFAIQQIDEVMAEMGKADGKTPVARPSLLPASKAAPVRPPLKHGASKLAARRKPLKKKPAKKKPPKSGEEQGGQD